MNLRILQYLIAVADIGHFGQAADKCFVSQPTLSMQIKKFEDQMGIQIFERNNKSVLVTDIGQTIIDHARKVTMAADELKQTAKTAQNPFAGTLKLGIIPTLAPYFLPKIIPTITEKFPDLTLYISELQTEENIKQIHQGDLDLLILALPIPDKGLTTQHLFHENFYLAVPKTHRLANKEQVTIKDVSDEPMLLLQEGHCLRDQALEVCHKNKRFTVHDFQATSLETLRHMIAAGVGITLMPEMACDWDNPNISYVPFALPMPSREVGLAWRSTTGRKVLFDAITDLIRHT